MTSRCFARRTVVSFALAAVLLAGVACGSGAEPKDAPADRAATNDDEIVMRLIAYQPDELDVAVGTTVTWTQQDAGFHTVTSGTVKKDASGSVQIKPDDTFASGRLAKGKTFTFTFEGAGTYPYFCEIHPATMSGRISVA